MNRLIASILFAMALLVSGLGVTHSGLVGTAYADDGDGCGD